MELTCARCGKGVPMGTGGGIFIRTYTDDLLEAHSDSYLCNPCDERAMLDAEQPDDLFDNPEV